MSIETELTGIQDVVRIRTDMIWANLHSLEQMPNELKEEWRIQTDRCWEAALRSTHTLMGAQEIDPIRFLDKVTGNLGEDEAERQIKYYPTSAKGREFYHGSNSAVRKPDGLMVNEYRNVTGVYEVKIIGPRGAREIVDHCRRCSDKEISSFPISQAQMLCDTLFGGNTAPGCFNIEIDPERSYQWVKKVCEESQTLSINGRKPPFFLIVPEEAADILCQSKEFFQKTKVHTVIPLNVSIYDLKLRLFWWLAKENNRNRRRNLENAILGHELEIDMYRL